jgi:hypothetical protein
VFWAPRHQNSVELLRRAAKMQERVEPEALGLVTIAMDVEQEAVREVLRDVNPVGPAAWDRRAWSSDLASEFGIRSLPVVLLLDRQSRLQRCFLPESWDTARLVEEAVNAMLRPPVAPPAEPAEPGPADLAPASTPASQPASSPTAQDGRDGRRGRDAGVQPASQPTARRTTRLGPALRRPGPISRTAAIAGSACGVFPARPIRPASLPLGPAARGG